MIQYGTESRFYLNNISTKLKTALDDSKDKSVYLLVGHKKKTVKRWSSEYVLYTILAASCIIFIVTIVNNPFWRDNLDNVLWRKVIL